MSLALADELFIMTHDIQSGKARLSDPALGVGLSAALLAELVFSGSLILTGGKLLLGEYPPPSERLGEALHDQTRNQLYSTEVSARDWLATHRRLVVDMVAERLIRSGDLRREQQRRMGRTSTRFYPLNPSEAFIRGQRLASYLRNQIEINAGDALLAALLKIMAPNGALLELDEAGREYLEQILPLLPAPLTELVEIAEAAIGTAQRNPHF